MRHGTFKLKENMNPVTTTENIPNIQSQTFSNTVGITKIRMDQIKKSIFEKIDFNVF